MALSCVKGLRECTGCMSCAEAARCAVCRKVPAKSEGNYLIADMLICASCAVKTSAVCEICKTRSDECTDLYIARVCRDCADMFLIK